MPPTEALDSQTFETHYRRPPLPFSLSSSVNRWPKLHLPQIFRFPES
ncbi:hypothetical protein COLO4_27438 [Corchorus olitorius]|uniref:Uncharacterized protein n=1 Tax=Corchorus olitorius TaxID=93759 RepID=A0A1R3HR56_9ROSI|nr:hypothetical protein COLO4_27438 [Corchorus olitorius]